MDIQFENHGSIVLIRGVSTHGKEWLYENVGNSETQHWGDAIACEPRYCEAVFLGAQRDGLVLR
jgi:hypothetical protein